MKKIFLLFGASGNLGKAAIDYFFTQDYDEYYFFTRKTLALNPDSKIKQIIVEDISQEKNAASAFSKITPGKENIYFLFSTIGGYVGGKPIADTSLKDFEHLLSVNLTSAFLLSKYFARLISDSKGGSICFTSALSSLEPQRLNAIYGITKNSLNFLVKSLALEGEGINLTANAVAPYIIDTPENREWVSEFSTMVGTQKVCEAVQKIFSNWEITSGQIIVLPS